MDIKFGWDESAYLKNGDKLKLTTIKDIKINSNTNKSYVQMYDCGYRVGNDNLDYINWNCCIYTDVDYKWWYLSDKTDKLDNNMCLEWNKVSFNIANYLMLHHKDNILYLETSNSGCGGHFIFYYNCDRTEYNFRYYSALTYLIIKKAFTECGYKEQIEHERVLDKCTFRPTQAMFMTKRNGAVNKACTGNLNDYTEFDEEAVKMVKEIEKKDIIKEKLINEANTNKCTYVNGNNNYIVYYEKPPYNYKVEYMEHRGYNSRWSLFDSLWKIYGDKAMEEWNKCCEYMTEGSHSKKFFLNEPERNKWLERAKSNVLITVNKEQLKKFGYNVSVKKSAKVLSDETYNLLF